MPGWFPPPDVQFDHAAAAEAVSALTALHTQLTTGADREKTAARSALGAWDGLAATNFRSQNTNVNSDRSILAGSCLTLKQAISTAIEDATAAQIRADELQAQWEAERQAEIRAAQARAAAQAQAQAEADAAAAEAEAAEPADTSGGPQ